MFLRTFKVEIFVGHKSKLDLGSFNFDFNYNSPSDSKIEQLADLMKKKYVSSWHQKLQHSRKLEDETHL